MNTHLKQLWAAMKLPEKLQKSYKFFCRGLDIRVTKIMDADTLDSCNLCPSVHLMVQIRLGNLEQPFILPNLIQHTNILLHFLTQKLRHFNCPVTFLGFRCGNHIPAIQPLIGLIDGQLLTLEIKVLWCKGKQLCFCQYKSKKNLLLIRKKHHCFHPVMLPANNLI